MMLDRPYLGQKTYDLIRCSVGWGPRPQRSAPGWQRLGALPATFAALLSPLVVRVTLKGELASFSEVAESETYDWPLSAFLPGVLRQFDLPDCYRALGAMLRFR